jgi:hypothetical protein
MNRREFLLFTKPQESTAELSCEKLYMRYLDSTLDDTTSELFANIESSLSSVNSLRLTDANWLSCEELLPVQSILAAFRQRGGHIETVG